MMFHSESAIRDLINDTNLGQSAISNQLDKIEDDIKVLRPNDYELQIKSLQNEIKKLNSIINNQKTALKKQNELIDSMLNYLENLEEIKKAGGLEEHYDCSSKGRRIKAIKVPEFYICMFEGVGDSNG